jgi:hypothetical protein
MKAKIKGLGFLKRLFHGRGGDASNGHDGRYTGTTSIRDVTGQSFAGAQGAASSKISNAKDPITNHSALIALKSTGPRSSGQQAGHSPYDLLDEHVEARFQATCRRVSEFNEPLAGFFPKLSDYLSSLLTYNSSTWDVTTQKLDHDAAALKQRRIALLNELVASLEHTREQIQSTHIELAEYLAWIIKDSRKVPTPSRRSLGSVPSSPAAASAPAAKQAALPEAGAQYSALEGKLGSAGSGLYPGLPGSVEHGRKSSTGHDDGDMAGGSPHGTQGWSIAAATSPSSPSAADDADGDGDGDAVAGMHQKWQQQQQHHQQQSQQSRQGQQQQSQQQRREAQEAQASEMAQHVSASLQHQLRATKPPAGRKRLVMDEAQLVQADLIRILPGSSSDSSEVTAPAAPRPAAAHLAALARLQLDAAASSTNSSGGELLTGAPDAGAAGGMLRDALVASASLPVTTSAVSPRSSCTGAGISSPSSRQQQAPGRGDSMDHMQLHGSSEGPGGAAGGAQQQWPGPEPGELLHDWLSLTTHAWI